MCASAVKHELELPYFACPSMQLKHGKWLNDNPKSEEAVARDRAKARMKKATAESASGEERTIGSRSRKAASHPKPKRRSPRQLSIEDYLNAMAPQTSNG
jgi:hypothetical protein